MTLDLKRRQRTKPSACPGIARFLLGLCPFLSFQDTGTQKLTEASALEYVYTVRMPGRTSAQTSSKTYLVRGAEQVHAEQIQSAAWSRDGKELWGIHQRDGLVRLRLDPLGSSSTLRVEKILGVSATDSLQIGPDGWATYRHQTSAASSFGRASTRSALQQELESSYFPKLSPSGSWLAHHNDNGDQLQLRNLSIGEDTHTSEAEAPGWKLPSATATLGSFCWAPNERHLFCGRGDNSHWRIYVLDTQQPGEWRALTKGPNDHLPSISPNGQQLAFARSVEQEFVGVDELMIQDLSPSAQTQGPVQALTQHWDDDDSLMGVSIGSIQWHPSRPLVAVTFQPNHGLEAAARIAFVDIKNSTVRIISRHQGPISEFGWRPR